MAGFNTPYAGLMDDTADTLEPVFQVTATFYNGSGAAIVAKDFVAIDVSDSTYGLGRSIKQAPASADAPAVMGVALAAIADGEWGTVVVKGYVKDANVATGTAAETVIQPSATAGRCAAAGAATERGVGFTLEAGAANVADVWLY